MLSCIYMVFLLHCTPIPPTGGDFFEQRAIYEERRQDFVRTGPPKNVQKTIRSTAKSEPKSKPKAEPKPKPAAVKKSETNTDVRETKQPTYRLLGKFETTHYTAKCHGCIGITAAGYNVRNTIYTPEGYRVVAVDPRVIPLNSLLRITYSDGTQFTAKALDTGGAIKGYKLDMLVKSKSEAYKLGRVKTTVELLFETGD